MRMKEFEKCIKERRIVRFQASEGMINKELDSAEYDLARAQSSLTSEDYKWASVQAYYSMFHAAKGLVLRKGYREKGHYCLMVALRELYVKSEELDEGHVDNFELVMGTRHEADYALVYDEESARISVQYATDFLDVARRILK